MKTKLNSIKLKISKFFKVNFISKSYLYYRNELLSDINKYNQSAIKSDSKLLKLNKEIIDGLNGVIGGLTKSNLLSKEIVECQSKMINNLKKRISLKEKSEKELIAISFDNLREIDRLNGLLRDKGDE